MAIYQIKKLSNIILYSAIILVLLFVCTFISVRYFTNRNPHVLESFEGLRWQMKQKEVREIVNSNKSFRTTSDSTVLKTNNGTSRIIYEDINFKGEQAEVAFLFERQEGLIKVILLIDFHGKKDCLRIYSNLKKNFESNSTLKKTKDKEINKMSDVPFCNAVVLGRARKITAWKDKASKQQIILSLGQVFKKHVLLTYEFETYYERSDLKNE